MLKVYINIKLVYSYDTVAEEVIKENMNEFELNIWQLRKSEMVDKAYSESIFRYINSISKYGNITLHFTNDRILTLLDDEIITNEKRSGQDSLYLTDKEFKLPTSKSMDPTPTSQDTHIISRNTRGTKTDDGILTDLTFPTSQNTPVFDTNGSKDDDGNLTV